MTQESSLPVCVLTIAGSDSGGGAGIQADLKTFAAHDLHGLCAITAVTAQNTRAVTAVHVVPVEIIAAQVDAVFDDFVIGAVKLGMLADARVIRCVAALLRRHRPPFLVVDPVMVATSGARLLEDEALAALRDELLPLADLLTPNIPEAELLLGRRIPDRQAMGAAAEALRALGPPAVLLKGGHLDRAGGEVHDLLASAEGQRSFVHPRLPVEGHGTGCTLAAAVASRMARGEPLEAACRAACDYVHEALSNGRRAGRGSVHLLAHG